MRKKRLADWLEKMSAAFMVGAVLTNTGAILCLGLGIASFLIAMRLTDQEASQ